MTKAGGSSPARTWVSFALCCLIWGSTWLVITGQLGSVPPTWSVTYRFAIGTAVMFAMLVGLISASVANIIQAMDRIRVHSLPAMIAWSMAYGTLANALIAWIGFGPPVFDTRPLYLAGLAYLGIAASALVFSLYIPLVRNLGPGKAAYTSLVIPIIAMLLSSLFEDYRWTLTAALGGLLVLGGLFIALRPRAVSS